MDNIFSIVVPPSGIPEYVKKSNKVKEIIFHLFVTYSVRWNKIPSQEAMGEFDLLIDEDIINQEHCESNDMHLNRPYFRWKS